MQAPAALLAPAALAVWDLRQDLRAEAVLPLQAPAALLAPAALAVWDLQQDLPCQHRQRLRSGTCSYRIQEGDPLGVTHPFICGPA